MFLDSGILATENLKEWLNRFYSEPEDAGAESIQTGKNSEDKSTRSTPDADPGVSGVGDWAGLAREGDKVQKYNGSQIC